MVKALIVLLEAVKVSVTQGMEAEVALGSTNDHCLQSRPGQGSVTTRETIDGIGIGTDLEITTEAVETLVPAEIEMTGTIDRVEMTATIGTAVIEKRTGKADLIATLGARRGIGIADPRETTGTGIAGIAEVAGMVTGTAKEIARRPAGTNAVAAGKFHSRNTFHIFLLDVIISNIDVCPWLRLDRGW